MANKHLSKICMANTNRHLANVHLSKIHLAHRHLTNRRLADRHLANRHLADRHLPNRHLSDIYSYGCIIWSKINLSIQWPNVGRHNDFRPDVVRPKSALPLNFRRVRYEFLTAFFSFFPVIPHPTHFFIISCFLKPLFHPSNAWLCSTASFEIKFQCWANKKNVCQKAPAYP
jgi:hypothetical protein